MTFDWKKLLLSIGVAVVTYVLLAFVLKAIVGIPALVVILSLAVGAVVYQFVAWWEIKKLYEAAKNVVK
jgi:hypothetical protein